MVGWILSKRWKKISVFFNLCFAQIVTWVSVWHNKCQFSHFVWNMSIKTGSMVTRLCRNLKGMTTLVESYNNYSLYRESSEKFIDCGQGCPLLKWNVNPNRPLQIVCIWNLRLFPYSWCLCILYNEMYRCQAASTSCNCACAIEELMSLFSECLLVLLETNSDNWAMWKLYQKISFFMN